MDQQKRIVVTGSTRGIGKGMAAEFLRRGHAVVISGRSQAAVDQALTELRPLGAPGGKLHGVACEVSSLEQVQHLWDDSVRAFGGVDIWINNAGVSHPRQRAGELREDDIERVETTNILGMMWATQVAMKGMAAQAEGGYIYNMEGYGSNGMINPGMGLYGASKFALTYFNKCLLAETGNSKVRICYLSPGIVLTDLLKRDMGSNDPRDWERTKRIYNILADRVETVTPWLAEHVLLNTRAGARVAWLTGGKAAGRFFMSLFRKRQIVTDADLA
jgi:NAD(P)-dependent dehydrogenase (short-subunit alcohol dehydrogenase family)